MSFFNRILNFFGLSSTPQDDISLGDPQTEPTNERSYAAEPRPYVSPVPDNIPISSSFGPRNVVGGSRNHSGIDYAAPLGTPVNSIGDGTVTRTEPHNQLGNVVVVEHSDGRSSIYGHLSQVSVDVGQKVNAGQIIGASGNSGFSDYRPTSSFNSNPSRHPGFSIWSSRSKVVGGF